MGQNFWHLFPHIFKRSREEFFPTQTQSSPALDGCHNTSVKTQIMSSVITNFSVLYQYSPLRNTKLWICMEYCGGGSLQDIYHCK